MGIIRKLHLWYKAWKGNLSIDELSMLCAQCEHYAEKGTLSVRKILHLYFRNDLSEAEMRIVCKSSWAVQNVYLDTVCGKHLGEAEQAMLVREMPWDVTKIFPCRLDDRYTAELLAGRDALKIVAYCRSFTLEEKWELALIDNYKQSLTNPESAMPFGFFTQKTNGWKVALNCYLAQNPHGGKMTSAASQKALLELQDDELLAGLVGCADILHNPLTDETLTALIEGKQAEIVCDLLLKSYIPQDGKAATAMTAYFPQLKWQEGIALLRHALAKVEAEIGDFLGAQAPTMQELKITELFLEKFDSETKKKAFSKQHLQPLLYGKISPYMCAWVAYYYPEYGEKLYFALRKYAKSCAAKYRRVRKEVQ